MAPISTSSSSSATRSTSPSPTNVPPMPAFGDVFATANGIYSRYYLSLSLVPLSDSPLFLSPLLLCHLPNPCTSPYSLLTPCIRSLSKLSVSKDLPRFCPNIRIYKSHEVVSPLPFPLYLLPAFLPLPSSLSSSILSSPSLPPPPPLTPLQIQRPSNCDGAASHIADIKGFLLTLLTYLDPPHLVQAFEANFSKYVTEVYNVIIHQNITKYYRILQNITKYKYYIYITYILLCNLIIIL